MGRASVVSQFFPAKAAFGLFQVSKGSVVILSEAKNPRISLEAPRFTPSLKRLWSRN
jgi:hypothetical protein